MGTSKKEKMPLYPNLDEQPDVGPDLNSAPELVLCLPGDYVRLTMIEHATSKIIGTIAADLKCHYYNDITTVTIDRFTVQLNESIYVLHTELEHFVIGGSINQNETIQLGPVPGTQYRFALHLVNNVPDSYLTDFVCILMNTVNYRATFQPTEEVSFAEMDTGDKIGYVIGKSASGISSGLRWTGDQASQLMKSQSEKYVTTQQPNQQPTAVSDRTRKAVQYASIGSKYLAKGTGLVANAIGEVASKVGQGIAAEVARRNSGSDKSESKNKHIWIQLGKVIKSSVAAYGVIWEALEETAKLTARVARDEATACVTHKHGQEAGKVTYTGMDIGVNCTKTVFHVQDMGMKRICKRVAKTAGTDFLKNEIEKRAKRKQNAQIETVYQPQITQ